MSKGQGWMIIGWLIVISSYLSDGVYSDAILLCGSIVVLIGGIQNLMGDR